MIILWITNKFLWIMIILLIMMIILLMMMILRYCDVFECVCYSMNGETGMSHAERRAQLEAANKVVFTFSFSTLFSLLTKCLSIFVHWYVGLLTKFFLISSILYLTFNFRLLPTSTFFTFTLISFLAILDL